MSILLLRRVGWFCCPECTRVCVRAYSSIAHINWCGPQSYRRQSVNHIYNIKSITLASSALRCARETITHAALECINCLGSRNTKCCTQIYNYKRVKAMDELGWARCVDFRPLIRRGTEKCDFKAKTSALSYSLIFKSPPSCELWSRKRLINYRELFLRATWVT